MILTTLLAVAGIAGIYFRLRGEFQRSIVAVSLVLIAGATPLAWYTLVDPSSRALTAFAATAWCGAAVAHRRTAARSTGSRLAWAALGVLPITAVMWIAASGEFELAHSRALDVLFSPWQGVLSLTPVMYFAVVGTLLYLRRDGLWAGLALALLSVATWIVGASSLWLHEPGFGGRALLAVLAVLVPGLAYLLDLARRRPLVAVAPLAAIALLWNHLLMVQYTVGLLPKDEPISFARLVRQQADLLREVLPAYPFAFPANVLFAWREGVPVERYDVLTLERRLPAVDLALDRTAERFLLDGWSGPTAEGEQPGWWIGGREATIVVPLARTDATMVRVALTARTRYEEPAMIADLAVLLNGREIGSFAPVPTAVSSAQFVLPASMLRDGFNKITLVSRGVQRMDPSDNRPPGPVARRAERGVWPVAVYSVAIAPVAG